MSCELPRILWGIACGECLTAEHGDTLEIHFCIVMPADVVHKDHQCECGWKWSG